ncbi:allantoate amidohydrolase [Solimonas marina]|uniref:Allantoate amidohydrolase n=1 Tax=Solimonas marina TaxID=2714601 RepID=A0A969WBC4_9GAMM|nr:allantoate amidohydrolase [Solimonas marina]
MIALATLNQCAAADFVAALDGIFEHSPWIAERSVAKRPFATRFELLDALCATMFDASADQQLALVREHPELAGAAAMRGELTAASTSEQAGAGLTQAPADALTELQTLNAAYRQKFGFPFVISVKGRQRGEIVSELRRRLAHDADAELRTALTEIARIADFRLAERFDEPAGAEILAMADALAAFSEDPDALVCTYLSDAHQAAARKLRDWMLQAGLDAQIDAIGNVVGRCKSDAPAARTLITGSHYDTVIDAGRYDGRLGILLPIVVLGRLRRAGVTLPFDVEIIGFSEEEGVRFRSTFLGSSAVAGRFDPALLTRVDEHGVTLDAALRAAGHDPGDIDALARDPQQTLGYVEVHIEQGPVLLDERRALGVVTAIAGSRRFRVSVEGRAGHAGTVPMNLRQDAAAAAAEIVLAVERHCGVQPGLVGTVGKLDVPNGAVNVVPGRCELTIDIRAPDDALRDAAVQAVFDEIASIGARRRVRITHEQIVHADAVPCAPVMQRRFDAAIRAVSGDPDVRHLPSGAGHDAMMLASLTDMGMLFVRCGAGGVSHNPEETLSEEDAAIAAAAFSRFLTNLADEVRS